MTKRKSSVKKSKFQNERIAAAKKKFIRRSVLILILIAAVLLVTTYLQDDNSANNQSQGNSVQGYSAFDFKKQGELSFNSAEGMMLSKIDIEIADNSDERATGLMYRDKLKEDQGMFFIFERESSQSFWMRNTVIPLDIMFINREGIIVKIHKNTTPFSEQSYPSVKPAMYVVEVNAGYSDRHNIKEGDKIVWRRV
jgi:uncharacterized protein